ncbi:MAG: FAD-dependent oxidoreductase [Pseudomonadota bacterium]
MNDILIIGAGMAGLSCAGELARAGHQVTVLDKGRGPGGRMAARRAEIAGESVSFDHGAQFLTARDAGFAAQVSEWEAQGVVARWQAAEKAGGDIAWVGTPGMNGPIRAMAQKLDVRWGVRAETLSRTQAGWRVETHAESFEARTVLVCIPAEQASVLLEPIAPDLAAIPASVVSEPCWAVMAAFSEKLGIEADGLRDADAPISWAARNSAKPERVGGETWVLHTSPQKSREILDMAKEDAAQHLLGVFFDQTGTPPVAPIHCVAHRWLYAMPAAATGEPARYDAKAHIGIAGDYLHSPRVEGAFLSGKALAAKVLVSS